MLLWRFYSCVVSSLAICLLHIPPIYCHVFAPLRTRRLLFFFFWHWVIYFLIFMTQLAFITRNCFSKIGKTYQQREYNNSCSTVLNNYSIRSYRHLVLHFLFNIIHKITGHAFSVSQIIIIIIIIMHCRNKYSKMISYYTVGHVYSIVFVQFCSLLINYLGLQYTSSLHTFNHMISPYFSC